MKYAFVNGVILDGTQDMEPQSGTIILVDGEKITAIVDAGADTSGYEKIDLGGKYIMPGLINMHIHLPSSGKPKKKESDPKKLVKIMTSNNLFRKIIKAVCRSAAQMQLNSGVTTIRTVGGVENADSSIRDDINAGKTVGPRILAANMAVSVPDGHMAGSLAYVAESAEQARDFVAKIAEDKPDLIKLMITGGVLDAKVKGEPGVLKNRSIYNGLYNSIVLSVLCAFFAGTIGILAGYAIVRKKGTWLSNAVNHLTFFPYLIPSMAFGAIYLSMFALPRGPIPALYGTFSVLVLIGTVKYLPFATKAGVNSMLQLGGEIEEAGIIMGIPWWKRMVRIIMPIQKTSILSGYLLPYISCMRELSLFILLISPSSAVLTTMLFQYNEKGWNQYANAINLLIVLVVLLSNWIINKLTGASIDKGIG